VVGLDNLNQYYDVGLKHARLAELKAYDNFRFVKMDLTDEAGMMALFAAERFNRVVHLAAQAGVRYSTESPMVYAQSNMVGFMTILEGCRDHKVEHLVYASSSSVYGLNHNMPFNAADRVDHPVSLYAATKKSNELMAHSYSHLYDLPTTGLRLFTVYGPWGRPDMALFKFTDKIINDQPIKVYNHGDMQRDFTYVDDIVASIVRIQAIIPGQDHNWNETQQPANHSIAPYRIYNVGNVNPVKLLDFIEHLEQALGKKANKQLLPMQPGDVYQTYADVEDLFKVIDYRPQTNIAQGVEQFVQWYKGYYKNDQ
jgi:UDP-glucuronate 4-epimerase